MYEKQSKENQKEIKTGCLYIIIFVIIILLLDKILG